MCTKFRSVTLSSNFPKNRKKKKKKKKKKKQGTVRREKVPHRILPFLSSCLRPSCCPCAGKKRTVGLAETADPKSRVERHQKTKEDIDAMVAQSTGRLWRAALCVVHR